MKKNFLLGFIAFAAMAVTSCTNDEMNEFIPQEKAIEFGTYLGRDAQSRAQILTSDGASSTASLQTLGFGVLAYLHDADHSYTSANFMKNVQVKGSGWDYTDTKYWPTQSGVDKNEIDFLAYGPYSASAKQNNITIDANCSHTLTFEVPENVRNQTDLIVAAPVLDQTRSGSTPFAEVEFDFTHMLSRIAFYAKTAVTYTNTSITINSITLTGSFASEGTVTLSDATPTITGTPANTSYILTATGDDAANLTGTALTNVSVQQNKTTDYLMLIPNTTTVAVTVNYTVKNTSDNTSVTNELTTNYKSTAFAANTAYAINLSIGLNAIEFDVNTLAGWSDPETEVEVQP